MQGDPAAIEAAQATLQETWAEVDGIKKDVDAAVSQVGGFWTGEAAALYGVVHQEYQENVGKLTRALTTLAETMGDVALRSYADIEAREDIIKDLSQMNRSIV